LDSVDPGIAVEPSADDVFKSIRWQVMAVIACLSGEVIALAQEGAV
jgi:hypothetical protein